MIAESFSEFINSVQASDAAQDIIDEALRDKESVLVDFKMNKGKMSGIGDFNTWIRFDVAKCKTLKRVLEKMVSSKDPEEAEVASFEEWRNKVASNVIQEKQEALRNVICDAVFSGNRELPFKILSAEFELTDIPTNDKVVVVKKATPNGIVTPPVSSEIMRIYSETGESFESIINRKKMEGDPKYRWITGVDSRKSFYEATLSIAIDYSLSEPQGKQDSAS